MDIHVTSNDNTLWFFAGKKLIFGVHASDDHVNIVTEIEPIILNRCTANNPGIILRLNVEVPGA